MIMQLLIDTTTQGKISLAIYSRTKLVAKSTTATDKISESLLAEIAKLLKKHKLGLKNLSKVLVNPGPGRFSSTRTGVATANALGFALGIPVAEWPSGKIREIVLPKYDKLPNITKTTSAALTPSLAVGRGKKETE